MKGKQTREEEPLISVIVPVYNVEDYVETCLESVKKQTYKNLEILIIDDGSSDQSWKICEKFVKHEPRAVLVHQQNQGLSGARNTGLRMARGDYFMFVDSDDYVAENMAEIMIDAILENDTKMSMCGYYTFEDGCSQKSSKVLPAASGIVSGIDVMLRLPYSVAHIVVWTKLYHRSIFNNLEFELGRLHEDELIMHKVMQPDLRIICVSEALYYYRMRKGSIMEELSAKNIMDRSEAFLQRLEFYCVNDRYEIGVPGTYSKTGREWYIYLKKTKNNPLDREVLEYRKNFFQRYRRVFRKKIYLFRGLRFIQGLFYYIHPALGVMFTDMFVELKKDNRG